MILAVRGVDAAAAPQLRARLNGGVLARSAAVKGAPMPSPPRRRSPSPRCARALALVALAGASCAAEPAPPPRAPERATPAQGAEARSATPAPPAAARSVDAAPRSLEEEARQILDGLMAVDTSHGGETAALEPVAERLGRAGIRAEIVESAPGRGNLVARLKGTGAKRPLLLLAHVDVVPVEGQPWTVPAFRITEKDGYLYGRGVGDDKGMAAAIVAVALELARAKTPLARDVIVALTAGEETGGDAGVRWLVQNRRELIDAEIALNEGGAITLTDDNAGVRVVTVGAAEKTFQSFRLRVKGPGGHSSVPPTDVDPVRTLARALGRVADFKFEPHVVPAVTQWLGLAASWEKEPLSGALQRASQSAPKVAVADADRLAKDRIYNALVRTTCVTTMLQGSPQDNVLPTTAEATINCRILPDETREGTRAALERAINDPAVEVRPLEDIGTGGASPVEGEVMAAVRRVAGATWPGVPVVASMGTGATDSRHLRAAGIQAYGLGVMPISQADARAGYGAHGPDERRAARWVGPGVRFLRDVTLTLAR
jgi:acetylornithine deacetylase/succinyl-diaminopimelate desuccinylase-like protein